MSLFREVAEAQKALTQAQKDTDRRFKDTDHKLNQLEQLFTSQWGRLMEALVEGDLVRLLTERGITIADTTTRLKGKRSDGGNYEFDIIAHNGEEVVVVEVKTTLRPEDVKGFLNKLNHLKTWIPRYAGNRLYGAMAWLTADAGAEAMVENRGLFSIRATGDSASILNAADFQPRAWSHSRVGIQAPRASEADDQRTRKGEPARL
jgi:Holliday junction resolvase-like predicted endonuclease